MTKTVSLFRLSSEKPSRTVWSSREASTAACTPTVVRIGIDSSSLDSPRWIRSARKGTEADLDKQGRVMIPAQLIEHAKLGREVVVAGVHDRLEIWDRAAWRTELAEVEGSAEDVAERLADQHD
jgi:MraZ protein, putative antitoxin-like